MNDSINMAHEHVAGERLDHALAALARFGLRDDGGVAREALTPVDLAARRHLIEHARRLGCEVATDDCANLFFRRPGKTALPAIVTGSHIDTQPVGGKLDGAYGVVAALEAFEALNQGGIETLRPLEVVVWTNEEGSRFAPGAAGSSAFVEPLRLAAYRAALDHDGVSFGSALDQALAATADVPRRPLARPYAACIELHIEQGPVLERAQTPLGIVSAIQGVRWYSVNCIGTAAHAGTTPMDVRVDAMAAAVAIAGRLYALARDYALAGLLLTLGRWRVVPNSTNTIPGEVEFSIDVRCVDSVTLDDFEKQLEDVVDGYQWQGASQWQSLFSHPTTRFPAAMVNAVTRSCQQLCAQAGQRAPLSMTSGAFHDAMYLAGHCPTAMIFVPSVKGISHNAAEYTAPADLLLGAQALTHLLVELANAD